jgi:hypothetical protein
LVTADEAVYNKCISNSIIGNEMMMMDNLIALINVSHWFWAFSILKKSKFLPLDLLQLPNSF